MSDKTNEFRSDIIEIKTDFKHINKRIDEIGDAMKQIQEIILHQNEDADNLAKIYIQNKVIPENKVLDASHIAIASIHNLNTILSFNFKHINKLKTKTMTESINILHGYKGITISTPMEVLEDEET